MSGVTQKSKRNPVLGGEYLAGLKEASGPNAKPQRF